MLHGEYKPAGGKLTVADITVSNGLLDAVQLSGDFFLDPDEALFTLGSALRGQPANLSASAYADIVTRAAEGVTMLGTSPEAVGIAVRRAISGAARWRDLDWEIVRTPKISPELNVALDEVFVTELGSGNRGPTLRLWDWDGDAVVIGSFQSVRNEVDEAAAAQHDTTVIRRISGGGAMYMQPEASITYSIVVPVSFVEGMSFAESYEFLDEWVLEALATIGIDATYEPLNDITSPAGKIGGAAQKRLANGAVLHHVTMAYDMDSERMTKILRIGREKLSDKGTVSAAKRVDPLKSQTGLGRDEIIDHLSNVFSQRHGASPGAITEREWELAERLVREKFTNPDWVHRIP